MSGGSDSNTGSPTSDNSYVEIRGADNLHSADVVLEGGQHKLVTKATVVVESVFGADPLADSWFRITNTGAINDTIRVQVAATAGDPTTPDRDAPAADVTITVTASEVGDELKLRDKIITSLNANANFLSSLKATKVKDNAIVHVSSKYRGEFWERTGASDFLVTTSGAATVVVGFSDLKLRGKPTELSRSSDDPRQGILGFSGSATITPGSVSDIFIENFKNAGSMDMRVNGSVTPVVFVIPLDAIKSIFVEEISFYGGGNGIQFGKHISQSGTGLTNGVLVEIKSNNETVTLPLLKKTEDYKNKFAFGGGGRGTTFRIDIQSGADQFVATFIPSSPFVLKKIGEFGSGNDDYVKITIQDNLTSGITQYEAIAKGFYREE